MKMINKKIATYAILFVIGAIMIAHGSRMVYQGLFEPESYYQPSLFDVLFDWTTLIAFGIFVGYYGLSHYLQHLKKK